MKRTHAAKYSASAALLTYRRWLLSRLACTTVASTMALHASPTWEQLHVVVLFGARLVGIVEQTRTCCTMSHHHQ